MTKQVLVTSALPYANGHIHLGHLLEHIQTDIFVRFNKLIGNNCLYFCADDAHGTAIMLSANEKNISTETFISQIKDAHIKDFKSFNIHYDHYHSTHSAENQTLCEYFYRCISKDNGIIKKEISQYYCEEKGLFLADRYIKGTCPKCNAPDQYGDSCESCFATYSATELKKPYSIFSKKQPVLKKSDHYFFNLEKYRNTIQAWLDTNPISQQVKNKLNEWLNNELKPWDISRDEPYFGFKIPGTTNKYFYVWLDAPIGYIATTQAWATKKGSHINDYWKNNNVDIHHFIGKDILYFHTLFWPAMLSASEFNLPKKVHIHGFLTINGEKMSKSRGTFILAKDYAETLNPDILRYYFASKLSSSMDDIDFNAEDFLNKVNSDVLGKFINIASRIGAIVNKKLDGSLSIVTKEGLTILNEMISFSDEIKQCYNTLDTNKGMRLIMKCADIANKYIDLSAPWALVKDNPNKSTEVCTTALNALRILAIYLSPVCPTIITDVFKFLGIPTQTWSQLNHHIEKSKLKPYEHILNRLTLDDVNKLFS